MRLPPAIELRSVASARARRWEIAVQAVTAGALAAWATAHGGGGSALLALAAAVGATLWLGLSVARRRHRPVSGEVHQLRWDGACWAHGVNGESPVPVACALMLDLQTTVVLRLQPAGDTGRRHAVRWLALDETDVGPEFRALCATVVATARGGSSTDDAAGAARRAAGPTRS